MATAETHGPPESVPEGRRKVVLVTALCGVERRDDGVLIDSKFHAGMLGYARRLRTPLACLLPRLSRAQAEAAVGACTVPYSELPYQVHVLSGPSLRRADRSLLAEVLDQTALAYIGEWTELNRAVASECRRRGIPYVSTTEQTLRTALDIMRAGTRSPLRRAIRELRLRLENRSRLDLLAHAAEVHANGHPTHNELATVNPRRMLFFDTRAAAADIPSEAQVLGRLASLPNRPVRLLYSGRYHPMKGALDVVKTGLELLRRGVDLRLDTFGAGPLQSEMVALVRLHGAEGRIAVHDPVPYRPDLIQVTRESDLFVSCHVQGDPSCTYLEAFACGVPIAGYVNEMWSELLRSSGGGVGAPVGDHVRLAEAIASLLSDRDGLRDASLRARAFAAANTMEAAWERRTDHLAALLARGGAPAAAPRAGCAVTGLHGR
jgi:glycosyltransferase involved in cell wall biosynthesis